MRWPSKSPPHIDRGYLFLILWCLAVLTVSSYPNLRPPGELGARDKLGHLVEYAMLGYFLGRVMWEHPRSRKRGYFVLALALGACFGAADELYQGLIPGRYTSGLDLAADVVGVLLGITAAWRAAAPFLPDAQESTGALSGGPGGG